MARNRIYKEQTTTTTYRHPITAKEGLDKVVNDFLSPLRVDFVPEILADSTLKNVSFALADNDTFVVDELKAGDSVHNIRNEKTPVVVPKEAAELKAKYTQIDKISGATLERWEGETELYRIKRYKKNEGWQFEYFATELEGRNNLK